MLIAKIVAGLFAIISAALSYVAARKGREASEVVPVPAWVVEPGDPVFSLQGWNAAILGAGAKSARLNASAAHSAKWAGVASVISGVAALFT